MSTDFTRGMRFALIEVASAISLVTAKYNNPSDYPVAVFSVLKDIAGAINTASARIKQRAMLDKLMPGNVEAEERTVPNDPFEELKEGIIAVERKGRGPGDEMRAFKAELEKIPPDSINWVVAVMGDKLGRNCLLGEGIHGSQETVDALRNAADAIEQKMRQEQLDKAAQVSRDMADAPPKSMQH